MAQGFNEGLCHVMLQAKPLSQSNEREALHQLAQYVQMRLDRCPGLRMLSAPVLPLVPSLCRCR